jgi:inorganic pyrophosphatase
VSFATLPALSPGSDLVNVVIDTPRGSRNKFKFDESIGVFRLSRILPAGMHFPYDFGWVPRTRAADGDALDVLVLMDEPTFPGCLVTVRLLGALRAAQREKKKMIRNDRLIAMAQTPVNRPRIRSLDEIAADCLHEIENFFVAYNRAQGREFVLKGRAGAAAARKLLEQARSGFDSDTES